MKALKLTLIVAILSFAMASYAGIDPKPLPAKKVVKISLNQAVKDHGLVHAMRAQLNISMLNVEPNGLYVGTVIYNQAVYKIYGTRAEWVKFFLSTAKTLEGRTPIGPE